MQQIIEWLFDGSSPDFVSRRRRMQSIDQSWRNHAILVYKFRPDIHVKDVPAVIELRDNLIHRVNLLAFKRSAVAAGHDSHEKDLRRGPMFAQLANIGRNPVSNIRHQISIAAD